MNFENAIKAGVKIIAGTDAGAGGAGWVPYGFFYKELELFVKHGMDVYETIQTATVNTAELLGVANELGSIEPGKYADFVIFNENPLIGISNLRHVKCVTKTGKIVCQDEQGQKKLSPLTYERYTGASRGSWMTTVGMGFFYLSVRTPYLSSDFR